MADASNSELSIEVVGRGGRRSRSVPDATDLGKGGDEKQGAVSDFSLARKYTKLCFTLNNYSNDELEALRGFVEKGNHKWVVGRERGDQGTPHLQGYIELSKQLYGRKLKSLNNRIHWERAKGSRKSNIIYCTKEGSFESTFSRLPMRVRLLQRYATVSWRPWQRRCLDIIDGSVDERRVHWFWEPTGHVGKSFLAKYLFLKYDAIIAEGKRADVFHQLHGWMEKNDGEGPGLVILDVPRTSRDFFNYGTLEALKNGLCYSGKYEGGVCCFEPPHVVVFANFTPDMFAMSIDRWWIYDIQNDVVKDDYAEAQRSLTNC